MFVRTDPQIQLAAQMAHEVNRIWCQKNGDHSQPSWDSASNSIQESIVRGVMFVYENPDVSCKQMHDSWMNDKREKGWKWGPIKNEKSKVHPCFTSYSNLSKTDRMKDSLFLAVVKSILEIDT